MSCASHVPRRYTFFLELYHATCESDFDCVLCLACQLPAGSCRKCPRWQGPIEIPTYLLGAEDPNPPFPLADARRIYPYTMLDDLTDRREAKTYTAVYLENDFLKAIVLPELGGHLYSLYDKV